MKKLSFTLLIFWFIVLSVCHTTLVHAQGVAVNATGLPPDPSAIFDVSSTNKGTLFTRMSTAQRDAIASPAKGLVIYNTDCDNIQCNTGTSSAPSWTQVFPSPDLPVPAGSISGTAAVCTGQNGVAYSVPAITNATSYTWAYSGTGAAISGSTNSITINFSGGATSGNLTVMGTNACGNGTVSANYAIIVSSTPSAPGAGASTPSSNQIAWNWNAVSGATGYKWGTTTDYASATDNGTSTTTTQTGLSCNTGYTLYVWAYNTCGNSTYATLTQATGDCGISLDASNEVTESGSSNTFTINTTNANEMILIGVNTNCATTCSNVTVTGAGTVTSVAMTPNGNQSGMSITLYACVPNTTGSHTITVTWGTNNGIAYAASYTGFLSPPTVAGNVQAVAGTTTTLTSSISLAITPAAANSSIFGDYWNFTMAGAGTVSWTNNTLIRTDQINCPGCFDASIASTQVAGTAPVTVTADDNVLSYSAYRTMMVVADVHP